MIDGALQLPIQIVCCSPLGVQHEKSTEKTKSIFARTLLSRFSPETTQSHGPVVDTHEDEATPHNKEQLL